MADEKEQVDNIEKNIDLAIEAQDGKTQDTGSEAPKEGAEETPKEQQPADSTGGTGDRAAQPKPPAKGEEQPKPPAGAKDLRLQDGTVVKSGPERRFYEQREIARAQLATRTQELEAVRGELQRAQEALNSMQQTVQSIHGIPPQNVALGARIVQDLQRDPVGTLKKLLAEAGAQGYSIDEIGSGVDMATITRMIEERLPQQDEFEYPSEQELLEDATQEANAFFGRHPDARPHDKLLANVLRDYPDLTLEDAYYQVRDAFVEKGFDWSLSLEQNVRTKCGSATTWS